MSSVEGDYDYEGLSPNAGLGVRVSKLQDRKLFCSLRIF